MDDKKYKLVQWLLYGLMAVSALLTVLFYLNPSNPNVILYWGYILFIVSVAVLLLIALVGIVKNPKGSFKVLIILAVMIIVGLVAYAVSKNTFPATVLEKYKVSVGTVKWVGAGLILTYIMMAASIGVFIYTALYKFFKK